MLSYSFLDVLMQLNSNIFDEIANFLNLNAIYPSCC